MLNFFQYISQWFSPKAPINVENIKGRISLGSKDEILADQLKNNKALCKTLLEKENQKFLDLLKLTERPVGLIETLMAVLPKDQHAMRDELLLQSVIAIANDPQQSRHLAEVLDTRIQGRSIKVRVMTFLNSHIESHKQSLKLAEYQNNHQAAYRNHQQYLQNKKPTVLSARNKQYVESCLKNSFLRKLFNFTADHLEALTHIEELSSDSLIGIEGDKDYRKNYNESNQKSNHREELLFLLLRISC